MFKLPFDPNKPISGKADTIIDKPTHVVFNFIGENFFNNYPKWAQDVIEFEPLDGKEIFIGAKARQLRVDQGKTVASTFVTTDYQPSTCLGFKGLCADYQDSYLFEQGESAHSTKLTYTFELLNVELFMLPFEKLIRIAIEDGAEATTENIKNLLSES
jgi:hypothetical protein